MNSRCTIPESEIRDNERKLKAVNPRGYVGDLDWSLSWRLRPDRLYMAMKGYFDESGTHGAESPVVIVGGFIATVEQWDAYERDLKALLDDYGVKKFHARNCVRLKAILKAGPARRRPSSIRVFCRWLTSIWRAESPPF